MQEKRKDPRLNKRLPFEIGCQYAVISTETKNISCSGAYCYIDRAIPVMSRVRISMAIPAREDGGVDEKTIVCEGIVLRYDPPSKEDKDQPAGSNTAIMFTRISKKDKNTIAGYVKNQLAKITD